MSIIINSSLVFFYLNRNVTVPKPAVPAAVVTTVSPTGPKPVTMAMTSMTSESAVVNTYEQRSPRHYPPPGTPVSKSAMTQVSVTPNKQNTKFYHGAVLWNELPQNVRAICSLRAFSYGEKLSRLARKHFDWPNNFVLFIWRNVILLTG
jgi:hypothetical protein